MKNNILYVVIVLFFATSCSSDNKPTDLSLNIETENPDVINLMRSIDSVSVISLKNTDGGFIGELAEILILDNHYYIYDDMRFAIRKYTKTGEYVKEFMKKGRANNE